MKKEFRYFSIFHHEKEQDYLQEKHRQGWKFVKVTGLGVYHFEACEPEEVVYQLDYNQEGSKHKAEYIQMFSDCGWEYAGEFMGYSYFRKPLKNMKGEEQIFSDDASKLEMMDRVYKGRMVPLIVIFLCCICPQLAMQAAGTYTADTVLFWMFVVLFLLYLLIFYRFAKKYKELKQRYN